MSKVEFSDTMKTQEALMKRSRFTEAQIVAIPQEADV